MDPSTNGHDARLVTAISRGDRRALATVYRDHKDDLLAAAYHLLGDRAAAEDVLQDVFVTLAKKAREIELEGRLRGYLLVTALNRSPVSSLGLTRPADVPSAPGRDLAALERVRQTGPKSPTPARSGSGIGVHRGSGGP